MRDCTDVSVNEVESTTGEQRAINRLASLILNGMQAVPVRLKILLDRLLSAVDQDQFTRLLNSCGWTSEDYSRGYMTQV